MNDLTQPSLTSLAIPGRGFEGLKLEKSDLVIPRAKLLQALSPEVAESKFDGAKAGLIINSLTLEVLPPRAVPIFCWKSWFRFNARTRDAEGWVDGYDPGALIWRSLDPDDARVVSEAKFGPEGETPLALTCLNFFSLFAEAQMPLILSFAKTSYKTGKQLLSLSRFCGGDMWNRAYQIGVDLQKNDQGTYYTFSVKMLGESSEVERQIAESWWQEFSDKAKELKVHEADEPAPF